MSTSFQPADLNHRQLDHPNYLTPLKVFHTHPCYIINKITTHIGKKAYCYIKNIQNNNKTFILNKTKILMTAHFPEYYISLFAFPFSVLHKNL